MNKKPAREISKRQAIREARLKRQRQQRLTVILGISLVALLLLGMIILPPLMRSIRQARQPVGEIIPITPNPRPQATINAMGDPNAPVKIIEYSDFQCPYCKQFADETEQQIIDAYVATGKAYFVYRSMGNFVSDNIGAGNTESRDAAEAAYCAGDQGKFWEYADMLYANVLGEDAGSFIPKRLTAFGETLGLDMSQFQSCLKSHKFRDQVNQDKQDGLAAGVKGTPSFVINGKLIEGALPFSDANQPTDFTREIEAALAAAGK